MAYDGAAAVFSSQSASLLPYPKISQTIGPMDDAQVYSWDVIYSPQPASPCTSFESTYNSSYVPSNFTSSPIQATSSLGGSPSPSAPRSPVSRAPSRAVLGSTIDYSALSDHLPTLYSAFQGNDDAMNVLQEIIALVLDDVQPNNYLINGLVLRDIDEFRCSVNTCKRHVHGSGWSRLDRAREHFRAEHLGSHFSCSVSECEVRCRRRSDLRAHVKSHGKHAPRFNCDYCLKSYAKRSNLNRHIEDGHRLRAPRRIRRAGLH